MFATQHKRARLALMGGVLALTAALAACSSSPTTSTPSQGSGGDAAVTAAKAAIKGLSGPITNYPAPGAPIDTSSLAGKTFYYIPITIQAESFQITGDAMKEALKPVGVTVQVCDGGASPDKAAACVNQAVGAGAAAIIADAIPYGLAQNAFDAAKAAGIPILISNQPAPDGVTNDAKVAYALGNPIKMAEAAANWIIADSNGKANVLINEYTDSPFTKGYIEDHALPILKGCSGCKTAVNQVSSANFAQIPSSTSSIVLKNPDADYFYLQYDTGLQPTIGGIQQAGAADRLKGVSTNGLLGALQSLKAGKFLYADVASHYSYAAYGLADFAMRMVLGSELPKDVNVPIRLITRDNVNDLGDLSSQAEESGAWFGDPTYKEMFAKLWGVK